MESNHVPQNDDAGPHQELLDMELKLKYARVEIGRPSDNGNNRHLEKYNALNLTDLDLLILWGIWPLA